MADLLPSGIMCFAFRLQSKCEQYWPDILDDSSFGEIGVRQIDETPSRHFLTRTFHVSTVSPHVIPTTAAW